MLPPHLHQTLARVATAMQQAREDWWIIGSAAVALHGVSEITVGDVDVLLGLEDANRILPTLGLTPAPGGEDALFRSDIFARWNDPPLTVEVMAGFHLRAPTGWTEIRPATRTSFSVDGLPIFAPSRAELHRLLMLFGRLKDIERARLLSALG